MLGISLNTLRFYTAEFLIWNLRREITKVKLKRIRKATKRPFLNID
ncbi:MAG: hypothetical protein PHI41_02930 [Erysipelotrichaceae bacterium]|nr:hypothetical protein [Erysipelotrichaceae bacterium]MDD3809280.1 hypothetical protein [Erysipelotrichaceae bacterium]